MNHACGDRVNPNPRLPECCGGLENVDMSQMDLAPVQTLFRLMDFTEPTFCVAVAAIVFNPLFWNMAARWEHRTRRLSALCGSPYVACYSLGFTILLLNVCRSHSMTVAMKSQPRCEALERPEVYYTGVVLMVGGTVLVVSSFLALGFTGTFLGDYFGILMEEKVTCFPFNLMENPMYWGSTANYLGLALIGSSPVGLVLTAAVALTYKVAIHYEGAFTEHIYQDRSRRNKQQ
ncbi:unnamed protein product [Knipowitschia caucasica]